LPIRGFWNQAARHPDSVAIYQVHGPNWTFGQLESGCNRLVHGLRSRGLKPQDSVVVACRDRPELLEIALACLQAGWYFTPLDPRRPGSEIKEVLRETSAALYLDDSVLDSQEWKSERARSPDHPPDARTGGGLWLYTSGSSGRPKGVRRPLGPSPEKLGSLAAHHLNTVCGLRPNSGAVHLVASPLYHSASLIWCLDQLHCGHSVVLTPGWDARAALGWIERFSVSCSLMVPTHFFQLLQLAPEQRKSHKLNCLRYMVHTGAQCPLPIKRQMLEWWGPVLYEVYGGTEGAATRANPEEWLTRPGTVGKGYQRIEIRDRDGSLCPPGQVGLVYIRRSRRYQPDQGPSSFTLGDLGYLDSNDYLFLVGRLDDVINRGGSKIYPVEIESVLCGHPKVAEVVVRARPDPQWGQVPHAQVVARPGPPPSEDELRDFCRDHLPAWKCPSLELVTVLGGVRKGLHGGEAADQI